MTECLRHVTRRQRVSPELPVYRTGYDNTSREIWLPWFRLKVWRSRARSLSSQTSSREVVDYPYLSTAGYDRRYTVRDIRTHSTSLQRTVTRCELPSYSELLVYSELQLDCELPRYSELVSRRTHVWDTYETGRLFHSVTLYVKLLTCSLQFLFKLWFSYDSCVGWGSFRTIT